MATGQVIGRHEVFEYTYKLGPAEERKRIKLVVIQRRDQRRKSLIAAQKYLEHTPVRLRVNLHRAQYGDPEVTTGSHHVPITLRRKVKAAPARTTTRVTRAPAPARPPQARAAHGLLTPPLTAPPPPEPARIELVDPPVPRHHSPGILVADPSPIVVVPGSSSDSGHDTPPIVPPHVPPSPSGSSISLNRPKVKRSGSFGSSFRRFPSLMGLIRRNSKNTAPPSVADTQHTPGYFDHDPRRSEEHEQTIIEERDSELGSPIGAPSGYGPPSTTSGRISRKPVPALPESPVSASPSSKRSRSLSLRRRPSESGSPRNRLVKPSPRNVPLPDSVRDPSVVGSPLITGAFPHSTTAGSHDGRSVHSRRTDRSVHQTPEYVHDEYLHDSPTMASRSLREPSITHHSMQDGSVVNGPAGFIMAPGSARSGFTNGRAHSREPSITQLSMRDGSIVRDRSVHGDRSAHGGSVHERSMHNGSDRSSGGRSIRHHELPSDGYRSPSIPDMPVRDIAFSDGDRENDHGAWSPRSGSGSDLNRGASPSLQPPSRRGGSPSLHVPSQRGSPSLHAPSNRGVSPSLHVPSRGASPSLHAPSSHRARSPSLHDPHSRVGSPLDHREAPPSMHAPSYNGNGRDMMYSPPVSMHAHSTKSHGASSVASSKVPMSIISRQFSSRPKSPLSASGSSHGSRKSNRPPGPEITPVPMSEGPRSTSHSMHAASIASHRTGESRSVAKSPLARTSEAPPIPSKAPSAAGSRVSEARTTRSSASRRRPN